MQEVVLVIHILIAIALVIVVLLQRSEGGGLGIGGGGGAGGGLMSSRSMANLLTRTTAILATGFIITSLTLTMIASSQRSSENLLDAAPETLDQAPAAPATPAAPAEPSVPFSEQ
jgi:preprotein translocase subunit SecG